MPARPSCSPIVLQQPADDAEAAGQRPEHRAPPDGPPDAGERAPCPAEASVQPTTNSDHDLPVAPYLLDQDFSAQGPDQKWSSDTSYIWSHEGWLYLALVIDLLTRRVVVWAVADRLHH